MRDEDIDRVEAGQSRLKQILLLLLQHCLLVVGFKGFSDILGGVHEVQGKGILLASHDAVQP